MLYESNYNQYYLEHSWGPWKKHMYISREGESGKFTYKYPKEYYDKYKNYKKTNLDVTGETNKKADENSDYYNSYYNDVDKVINRSVKATVNALNFGLDLKGKAEGYLTRFGNAVANAWNSAKSPDRTRIQAGKQFVQNMFDYSVNTVTSKRISASVKNLMEGAAKAVSNSWGKAKETASNVKNAVKNKKNEVSDRYAERNMTELEKQKQNRVR